MADRIITFNYAKDNYDAYKKKTIPNSLKTMTKGEINNYINIDSGYLTNYADNQLVPRSKVIGLVTNYDSFCYYFNGDVYTIVVQPDGKILVGGIFTKYKDITANNIIRLNPDGTVDTNFNYGTGFGNSGSTPIPAQSLVHVIKLQPDGKILVGGVFNRYNGVDRLSICRLNSNGSLDTTFNAGTTIIQTDSGFGGIIRDIVILNDSIFAGGNFKNGLHLHLVKLNMSNGTPNSTFIYQATVVEIYSMDVDSSNRLYIGGAAAYAIGDIPGYMNRINTTDGSVDSSFKTDSFANEAILCIKYEPLTNKILFGGRFSTIRANQSSQFINVPGLARISLNGDFDESFIINVNNNIDLGLSYMAVKTIVIGSNNEIYLGTDRYFDQAHRGILKINSTGTTISNFSSTVSLGNYVNTIAINNNTLYIGGNISSYKNIVMKNMTKINTLGNIEPCNAGNPGITYTPYAYMSSGDPCLFPTYLIYTGDDGKYYTHNGTSYVLLRSIGINWWSYSHFDQDYQLFYYSVYTVNAASTSLTYFNDSSSTCST